MKLLLTFAILSIVFLNNIGNCENYKVEFNTLQYSAKLDETTKKLNLADSNLFLYNFFFFFCELYH